RRTTTALRGSGSSLTSRKATNSMAITTDKPIVAPDAPNVAFPQLQIIWTRNLNGPVIATYTLCRYATDEYGVNTTAPGATLNRIPDLYALATERATAGKPALASALTAVLGALTEIEQEKGTI